MSGSSMRPSACTRADVLCEGDPNRPVGCRRPWTRLFVDNKITEAKSDLGTLVVKVDLDG